MTINFWIVHHHCLVTHVFTTVCVLVGGNRESLANSGGTHVTGLEDLTTDQFPRLNKSSPFSLLL